jgi:hypothetical protein
MVPGTRRATPPTEPSHQPNGIPRRARSEVPAGTQKGPTQKCVGPACHVRPFAQTRCARPATRPATAHAAAAGAQDSCRDSCPISSVRLSGPHDRLAGQPPHLALAAFSGDGGPSKCLRHPVRQTEQEATSGSRSWQRVQARRRPYCSSATTKRAAMWMLRLPLDATAVGQAQRPDRPTPAWLLCAAGGSAERPQGAAAKGRPSSGACRAGLNTQELESGRCRGWAARPACASSRRRSPPSARGQWVVRP